MSKSPQPWLSYRRQCQQTLHPTSAHSDCEQSLQPIDWQGQPAACLPGGSEFFQDGRANWGHLDRFLFDQLITKYVSDRVSPRPVSFCIPWEGGSDDFKDGVLFLLGLWNGMFSMLKKGSNFHNLCENRSSHPLQSRWSTCTSHWRNRFHLSVISYLLLRVCNPCVHVHVYPL